MANDYCFMNPGFFKALLAPIVACAFLSGCASLPADANPPQEQAPKAPVAEPMEAQPTDPEVMARVWAAEAAGAEGNLEQAAKEYLAASFESGDPEIAARATEVAIQANSWHLAGMAADRWVLLDPGSIRARQTATRALLIGGDFVQAEYQLNGLLKMLAEEPWGGWDEAARLLSHGQNAERGKRVLENLIAEFDAADNPYALVALSQVTARSGDVIEARKLASEALARAPGEVPLHVWAGRLALTVGDQNAALGYYQQAWRIDPQDREHALAFAELLRKSGRIVEANEVLASLPDTPGNRFLRIAIATQTGRRDLAESLYAGFAGMSVDDQHERAYHAARSAELLGRPAEAIEWYEQLSDSDQALSASLRRARLTADLGDIEGAQQILHESVNGANAAVRQEAVLIEAQILSEAGRSAEAMTVLNAAIASAQDPSQLIYTRALIGVEIQEIEQAIADLQTLLDEDPVNPTLLNALGYTLADETDRFEEAEELIQAAYELDPDEPAIIDSMGWIAYRLGRLDEAEMYLRKAFLLDRNAEIAAHLGEVLWAQNRRRDAIAVWAEAIKIDPENRILNETLNRLGVNL